MATQQLDPTANDEPDAEQLAAQELKYYSDALTAIGAREQEFSTGWWKQAEAAEEIYLADKDSPDKSVPYNILYSNTEVLLPSLYSATPKPDIRSRYKEQNIKPIPEVVQRFLTVAADPQNPGGDCFDSAMQDAVLSALVPGVGYVRLRYVENEAFPLKYESGHFKTLIWGKASRWAKVPWIAFKVTMKREQMLEQFGKTDEEAAKQYKPSGETEDEKNTCTVYEFWDKKTRKVLFLCDEWQDKMLEKHDDPLGLANFYPTPGLMMMTMRTGKFLPIPLYNYYRQQAEELNKVSGRLIKVLSAIKVRGMYNGLLGDDLAALLSDDDMDNKMVAAAEAGLLAQSGGIDKHVWMLPIQDLITVAKELYQAREAIKQVIYEITGISDIIRGASVAQETATAQGLKDKWGTVRLRRMQSVVANYTRDLFRMSIDCGSDHIPPEKWAAIVQMPGIPTAQEKQIAQAQLQYLQSQAQMQIPGMQPTAPPAPPDPKLVQAAQSPSWEEILGKIKTDLNRTYVINIQTSSTIDLDTAQDKSEVNEFMAAMGQLLPGLQGFVALGPTGLDAAKEILKQVCLRYKFGIEIADVIGSIQAPPPPPPEQKGPPPPTPEEIQAIKDIAASKSMKSQADMAQIQNDQRVQAAQADLDIATINQKKQLLGIAIQEANLRLEGTRAKLDAQKEADRLKAQAIKDKPAPAPAGR